MKLLFLVLVVVVEQEVQLDQKEEVGERLQRAP